ncbi:4Fe-4S binding protein [Tropicibacter naphthalenivorans]|uniref:Putative electron transport protein YccM n=1 Tax=Tropicibacter naphthalenivorans TaxID=441103 RepID=A0A0P1G6V5_9RHOB|nr:4Fe-4S binding protein [Tropicibacter naphthalenivorans]CUH77354.1 Putative electron transport protein YccM [Tropicibacter naphthalenivorans]SMC58749.1 Regulator of nitric oxide reductase transcription [Tropicibacter naphthalenivorans]
MGERFLIAAMLWLASAAGLWAETITEEEMAARIFAPMSLGERISENGVYELLNSGDAHAGYVFQTEPMAPLPGFSGAPINMLVVLDLEGRFLDVQLVDHNEPIFVSGLGQAPFHAFMEQYRGHSISAPMVVGTPYGGGADGSGLVYLDGVTKATASVRIAHESILAAALQVAREKMGGVASGPPAFPNLEVDEDLTFDDLIDQGLLTRLTVTNAEVNAKFAGTTWEDDDPEATDYPSETYLDLWVADLGPRSIARALLSPDSLAELDHFMSISTFDEPILVVETARHGLVSPDFVRNTAPDWVGVEQNGFPVAVRDADLIFDLADGVPEAWYDGTAMILRTDRRLGFDPASPWDIHIKAIREHGMFQPEVGSVTLTATVGTDERFYTRPGVVERLSPFEEAIRNRQSDLIVLAVFLGLLVPTLLFAQSRLAGLRSYTPVRLSILAVVIGFIGWWGQGQLSIVTPLATLQTALTTNAYAFLLYDPFSLLIWAVVILGFVLWGRGLFCGWLCPFGALQEFAHHLGRLLRLPRIEPSRLWDQRLKKLKYVALVGLIAVTVIRPEHMDKAAEIEPFKTAITTFFIREWYYVAYAAFWLILATVTFKGFCRYVCPLGALMAIGGALRLRRWIPRRVECGSPCQLCAVKCNYGAIRKTGDIQYDECFQCLDCVTIHDDDTQCVPLVLKNRAATRAARRTGHPNEGTAT